MTTHNNSEGLDLQQNAGSQQEQFIYPTLQSATRSTTDYVLEYRNSGLSVIPVDCAKKNPKIPSWQPFQATLPTETDIRSWWSDPTHSIALICGTVSGNIEVIDFDEKYNIDNEALFDRWKKLVDSAAPGLVEKLILQATMNMGYHIIYRCSVIEGNQILAERDPSSMELETTPKTGPKTLIETRGEGGYCLCYPSNGYAVLNGSLCDIPSITIEERQLLLSSARALNAYIKPSIIIGQPKAAITGNRPGDVFNLTGDHRALLEKHGWTYLEDHGENEAWQRPGKIDSLSATYHKEKKLLYVFSSNASPFDAGKAYTNFAIFALLETGGDYLEAAKRLAAEGYGELKTGRKGGSSLLLADVEQFIQSRCILRRNSVTGRVEIKGINQTEYSILGDYELNSLHSLLLKSDLPIGYDMLARHLNSDFVETYDPFVSYFESLPVWDGTTNYIEKLSQSVILVDPSESQQFENDLQRWLIGYVASAIKPDAVNQAAIIFTGEQGIGKSRWASRLVPSSLSTYQFTGTINPDNKDTLIYLAECLLINLDELETLRKADIGALKTIMTMPSVNVRRPYGRFPETMIRRASFVGSINTKEFLNDETGSRRFLTHEVKSFNFEAIPNIDLVMAQAFKLFKEGKPWWFTEAEIAEINTRNLKYSPVGYEEQLLLDTVFKGNTYWYTSSQIAEKIKIYHPDFQVDKTSVRNIGIALNKNGYTNKSSSKGRKYNVDLRPIKENG